MDQEHEDHSIPAHDADDNALGSYLEKYMGQRAGEEAAAAQNGGADVYTELRQKEHDLILAAELGRALLADNEELKSKNERLMDEFEDRIQQLEKEKASLRVKLGAVEQDYDNQMRELQTDVVTLREELRRQQASRQELERERAAQLRALASANERLADDCRQRADSEQRLSAQVAELQSEVRARRAAMQEHLQQLAQLKQQLQELHSQKADLERRLLQLTNERDCLQSAAEEQQLRVQRLERRDRDQSVTIATQEARIHDLQETAASLHEQVASLAAGHAGAGLGHFAESLLEAPAGESLYSELSADQDNLRAIAGWCEDDFEEDDADCPEVEAATAGPQRPSCLFAAAARSAEPTVGNDDDNDDNNDDNDDDDDIEVDEDDAYLRSTMSDLSSPPELPHDDEDVGLGVDDDGEMAFVGELRHEVVDVYYQLRSMCADLSRRRLRSQPGKTPDELAMVEMDFRLGSLRQVLLELKGLMGDITEIRDTAPETAASDCVQSQVVQSLQEQVRQKDQELEEKTKELQRLSQELSNVQLHIQQQESLILQESELQAQRQREEAVQRRCGLEDQLCRMKAEVERLNGELSRAAEERGSLSEQISLWCGAALAEPESDLSLSLASCPTASGETAANQKRA